MKVQERRNRGKPKRRWLDSVRDGIREKGMSWEEVYDHATLRRIIMINHRPPHKSGNKMKKK